MCKSSNNHLAMYNVCDAIILTNVNNFLCLGGDDSKFARIGHILRSSSIMKYSMDGHVKISVRTVLEIATSPRKIS